MGRKRLDMDDIQAYHDERDAQNLFSQTAINRRANRIAKQYCKLPRNGIIGRTARKF